MLAKLSLIFLGLLFMLCVWLGRKGRTREPLEGEKITVEDVEILLQAIDISLADASFWEEGKGNTGGRDDAGNTDVKKPEAPYLTYGQYIKICEAVNGGEMGLPDYAGRYEEGHAVLKEDWYHAYRLMLAHLDTESSVWETSLFVLKIDTEENTAYTDSGGMQSPYHYHSSAFEDNVLRQMKVYVKGSELLAIVEVLPGEYKLGNVWVTESNSPEGSLECFYHQVTFLAAAERPVERERVADLTFRDGKIADAREKNEKVHGRLLCMTEKEMEIEGCGTYQVAEDMEVYKLYGTLETKTRADLRIGYADSDYVVFHGKICAVLVSQEEAADRIRVLLKNTAENSNYHDRAELTVDGETIQVRAEELGIGERRSYQCDALTDKVLLHVEGSTKEDNAYRGTIECYRTADGMVLINELPLEEYLYAVVPSEMPASYPLEALKAQAVCARTYAYRYILRAGLPQFGAHVDDTTSYQVYHNISENTATTTAVKETDGVLLAYQGEPARNYYYSTSCGVGTDAGIWQSEDAQDIPYLQAAELNWPRYEAGGEDAQEAGAGGEGAQETGAGGEGAQETGAGGKDGTPADLLQEEGFYRFITSTGETDLEKEEPWYRWKYTVGRLDQEALQARIQERFSVSPASVLTKTEGDYYVSQPIERLGDVKDISIVRRGAGGVAEELLIGTDTGTYKVLSEYAIRSVLCDGVSKAVKQDGSSVVPGSLLPSGFFAMETGKKDGNVVGYTLIGGGYGHGVGMSQNGARALGEEGVSYRRILEFFFPGCELAGISHS